MKPTPFLIALYIFTALGAYAAENDLTTTPLAITPPTGSVPTGITEIHLEAANAHPLSPTSVIYTNVRAKSASTTLDDYLAVSYTTGKNSLALTPSKVDIYKSVGIYEENNSLLLKDISNTGTLKQGTTTFAWGAPRTITPTTPITATVETGSSLNIWVGPVRTGTTLEVVEMSTGESEVIALATSGTHFKRVSFLRGGAHQFRIAGTSSATMVFTHGNLSKVVTLVSGGKFAFSSIVLPAKSEAYGKVKVRMNAGQQLKVTMGSSSLVDLYLVASNNTLVGGISNMYTNASYTLPRVPATGDYYLVVVKDETIFNSTATSSGTIQVLN